MNTCRILVGTLGREIGQSQGLYLLRKAEQRKTLTYIRASRKIGIHDPSDQAVQNQMHGHWNRQQIYYPVNGLCITFSPLRTIYTSIVNISYLSFGMHGCTGRTEQ
jgi:hypothetical protein